MQEKGVREKMFELVRIRKREGETEERKCVRVCKRDREREGRERQKK